MSDSNRIRVSIVPQVSFAAGTPATPAFQVLATTGQSIRDRVGYQQSQTINNDRNVQDLIRLSKSAGGGIPMELTWSPSAATGSSPAGEGLMMLINAALASGAEDAVASFTATTGGPSTKTISGTGFISGDAIEVGDIIKVSGAVETGDNGYYKVAAVTDILITVEADSDFVGTDTVTVTRGPRLKNGTSEQFFTIEVARLDLDIAQIFTGCAIDGMDFNVADEAITSVNFSIAAADSTFVDTPVSGSGETGDAVFFTGATYTDPTTSPVLDSIGVPEIRSEGAAYAAKGIQMSMLNNVSPRTQIGGLGAQSMRFGEFGSSGRISAYMEDFSEMIQYANNTSTDIWFVMIDENEKGFSMSLPQVKFGDVGADVTGSNTDVLVDISATAIKDPTELCTVRLQRWD